jgi:DNA invertase Pin-like site-specific DNA recombinase
VPARHGRGRSRRHPLEDNDNNLHEERSWTTNVVTVTKLHRPGRPTRELLDLLDGLERSALVFVRLGIRYHKLSRPAVAQQPAAFAEFERDLIQERTTEGRNRPR